MLQRSLRVIIQRDVFKRLDDDKIITTDIELPIAWGEGNIALEISHESEAWIPE